MIYGPHGQQLPMAHPWIPADMTVNLGPGYTIDPDAGPCPSCDAPTGEPCSSSCEAHRLRYV